MVKKDFQNYFPTKSYSSVSQNIKMRNGLIAQKAKVLRCSNFALILDFLSVTVWAKKIWKYCFDPKLHVGFCYKIWKGVFRAHCTQIWSTSRLAFGGYMLVLHYQVHGEERFPKLFSYEKLFVRFAKYQNAKRAHCTKNESTKVPKFCTDIRLFKCDCMSKKKFENIVSIQSYMYDFVIKFEKVCLGLIAPKFEVPQGWPSAGTC